MNTEPVYNTKELVGMGKTAERQFLNMLGYDHALFDHVKLRPSGDHQFEFELRDNFQSNLAGAMQYKVGWCVNIPIENIWDKLATWPTREQRELTIMARKLTAIDADLDKITSAQVKAFVARLQPDIDALRRQITDQTGNDDTVVIT